ncbi:uncharacterized protein NDAI_0I01820 [Naumovozyma dairenensis CBS 421]|uniref:Uncharacterized protein n=1 Tax=Naumovozyma dairenensis (strain ATCC 10597 / BCRC 20456 / CBS 421 / NBRC 0211 / NRRL Y-12639) TaxID=1071378 RepID=G0WG40_NAUDC|nr:hypothetical protein NDAI_0I01820 [Naumovozyma dairenensis CBS 421]CCD26751.1 hypothetical protein NDAI_0I01820 [Naumovozyma dairenensis CBS 421]
MFLDQTISSTGILEQQSTSNMLCDQYHQYDTGVFDSIITTLINTFNLNIFKDPNNINTLHIHKDNIDIDPIENVIVVLLILFIISLIILIIIGVLIIVLVNVFFPPPPSSSALANDDEEKQLQVTNEKEITS